jgi:HPt (histidine-containing phosphotransfer) domain-containing protein
VNPLEDKLAELRQRFVARAGEEIAGIDRALADGDREAVIDRAHAIAGIAGMFGFKEVGQAAFDLEDAGTQQKDLAIPAARLCELLAALPGS